MTRCLALLAAVLMASTFLPGLVRAAQAFEATAEPPAAAAVLRELPPVAPGVTSFPLVAGNGPAAERINRSLATAEQQLRRGARPCPGGWTRTVSVTSNGPRFLSFLVEDASSCGDVCPRSGRSVLVYDLRSGEPVAWQLLLPARFAVRVPGSWVPAAGPAAPVRSWPLLKLYRAHYPAQVASLDLAARNACRDSVEDGFAVWPDVAAGALMIQPMPQDNAAAVCAVPVALTVPVLRELGASSILLQGLGVP